MIFLSLAHQSLKHVEYTVNIPEDTTISLENHYDFHIDYDETREKCMASLKHIAEDTTDRARFYVCVHTIGFFECSGILCDDDKKKAHIQAYAQLFPYVQNLIATLTASSGLPPLMVARDQMDEDSVHLDITKAE